MLITRQEHATKEGIHIANERVASIDNDIADLLSRGDVNDALRFPVTAGLVRISDLGSQMPDLGSRTASLEGDLQREK